MNNERDGVILHFSGDASTAAKVKVFNGRTKAEVTSIPSTCRLMIYGFKIICDAANVVQVFDDIAASNDSSASSTATLGTALLSGSYAANSGESSNFPIPFGFKAGMRPTIKASGGTTVRFIASGRIVSV
jgi:hypothetical protein